MLVLNAKSVELNSSIDLLRFIGVLRNGALQRKGKRSNHANSKVKHHERAGSVGGHRFSGTGSGLERLGESAGKHF